MIARLSYELNWPPVLAALRDALGEQAGALHLVGGAVRDMILRRPLHDLDFASADDGRRWARRIANRFHGSYFSLDPERGVGRALIDFEGERYVIDVAQYRGDSLDTDLAGRDFTLNAIALPLAGDFQTFYDPLGGLADLQQKRLKLCGPDSIRDDPVRALRAVRQSVAFRLFMTPETRAAIKADGVRFVETSPERIRDEFMNMLGGPRPHVAVRTLDMLGLLRRIVPEIEAMRGMTQSAAHTFDVLEHTYQVMERLDGVLATIAPNRTDETAADSALGMIVYLLDRYRHALQAHLDMPLANGRSVRALLMLSALLHDCGKPASRSVGDAGAIHFYEHERIGAEMIPARAEALRLSNEETDRLAGVVRYHMRPAWLVRTTGTQISRRSVYRYWNTVGETVGIDVCLIAQADYLGKVGPRFELNPWLERLQVIGALLDARFNRRAEVVAPPPLLNGNELMQALKLRPGERVGQLLALIREAQAAGEIDTREAAIAFAEALQAADSLPATDDPIPE